MYFWRKASTNGTFALSDCDDGGVGISDNDGHLGISKRGNPYLRKMFIHGARAAVLRVKREGSCLGQWMSGLESRAARNVVMRPETILQ